MRNRKLVLKLSVVVGILAAVLAVIHFMVTPKRVRLHIEGPAGLAVKGYIEADGQRQAVTALPFHYEGRVRRLSYVLAPQGEQTGVWAEVFDHERRVATNSSSPGKPAIRAWMSYNTFGPNTGWQESYHPQADGGWTLPPE